VRAIGVIPARWGSTRFPGKPLTKIAGKELLAWVIEGSQSSSKLSEIVVATDHPDIAALAKHCGARAVMTDSDLATGTDRVHAAVQSLVAAGSLPYDVVINIQGDEPLIRGELLDRLIVPFESDSQLQMATLGRPLTRSDLFSDQTAKIVLNVHDEALYFSRYPIPYSRIDARHLDVLEIGLKHIGMYAYRMDFLRRFCAQKPTPLELAESLEQLRALHLGARIKVIRTDHDSWGVDKPEDVQKIEALLSRPRS
jgi:3-deoxy-manno-octulosonate cytidylyltransferase (CMP-KDO synthetase)